MKKGGFMLKREFSAAFIVALIVLAVCLPVYSAEINMEQAKTKMVTELYKGNIGDRGLYGHPVLMRKGTKIASWREPAKVVVDNDSWFFFVDEQPRANWEHKAQYVLVNKISGVVKAIPAQTPPINLMEHKPLNKVAESQLTLMRSNLKFIRDKAVMKPIKPIKLLKQKRYAVLVSGGIDGNYNYPRYWNDMSFIYKALKQKYGFTDNEIFVLYANGTHNPNADLDGDGVDDIDYAATKANLTTVMNYVAANIPVDGKFFFYSTNHGGSSGVNNAHLYLWGDWITDAEFAALTKNIKCAEAIYVMEQCYSGGMMDNILQAQSYPCTNPKVVVMTAARPDEVSWGADTEGDYDEYVYHWTSAIFGKTPTGAAVNADTNGDGKVTVGEAHEYAKSKDNQNEHPLIGSCITGASDATLSSSIILPRIIRR
jgi:Peptidase C13 family